MELPRYFDITADPEGVLPRSAGRNARVSYVAITTLFTNEPEIAPKRASREVVLGLVLAKSASVYRCSALAKALGAAKRR